MAVRLWRNKGEDLVTVESTRLDISTAIVWAAYLLGLVTFFRCDISGD